MTSSGKFSLPAETHYFPSAGAGTGAALCVSVRSLPRSEEPPLLLCSHGQGEEQEEELEEQGEAAPPAPPAPDSQDLRRCLGRALTDIPGATPCGGSRPLTKSDSLDSMLGDSLLDPPQTRARMTPRRYQSPSRCGSPSHEAPEPLYSHNLPSYTDTMVARGTASSSSSSSEPDSRLARHDLLRRRDLSLFHGLHPRVLTVSPRLSLPPRGTPCRALAGAVAGIGSGGGESPHSDRLPGTCTRQGKHVCEEHEVEEGEREEQEDKQDRDQENKDEQEEREEGEGETRSTPSPPASAYQQAELGAKQKGWSSRGGRGGKPYSRDSSSESGEAREGKEEKEERVGYRPCRDADYGSMEQEIWGLDRDISPR